MVNLILKYGIPKKLYIKSYKLNDGSDQMVLINYKINSIINIFAYKVSMFKIKINLFWFSYFWLYSMKIKI